MVLHELHVLQRHTDTQRHRRAVAGARVRIGRHAEDSAQAARGEHRRLSRQQLEAAVQQVPADDADARPVLHEPPREVLLVDGDVALHHLLVEHLDEDVAGDVGREDGARRAGGPERPLCELAVFVTREVAAPVLELVDVAGRLGGEELDSVLVAQVVGALDGVEGVGFRAVFAGVAQCRIDPTLGRAGVATDGMELGDDCDVGPRVRSRDRGAHTRAAAADDEHIVRSVHDFGRYTNAALGSRYERGVRRPARSPMSARNPADGIGQPPPDTARSRERAARRDSGPTDSAGPELHSTTCPRIAPDGGNAAVTWPTLASSQDDPRAALGAPVPRRVNGNGAVLERSFGLAGAAHGVATVLGDVATTDPGRLSVLTTLPFRFTCSTTLTAPSLSAMAERSLTVLPARPVLASARAVGGTTSGAFGSGARRHRDAVHPGGSHVESVHEVLLELVGTVGGERLLDERRGTGHLGAAADVPANPDGQLENGPYVAPETLS